MLEVKIEKILPVTEARDTFNKLVDEVEAGDELYVLTKNGKPAAVLVGVHHLEKLTGVSHEELTEKAEEAEEPEVEEAPAEIETKVEEEPTAADSDQSIPTEVTPEAPAEPVAVTPDEATSQAAPAAESIVQTSGATADPYGSSLSPITSSDAPVEDPLDFLGEDEGSDTSAPVAGTPMADTADTTGTGDATPVSSVMPAASPSMDYAAPQAAPSQPAFGNNMAQPNAAPVQNAAPINPVDQTNTTSN